MSEDEEDDDGSRQDGDRSSALVNVEIKGKAEDLLGLGKAAKSPAAKSILKEVGGLISDYRKTKFGEQINRVDADRLVTQAEAKAKAALLKTQYVEFGNFLRERAGDRLIVEEVRSQSYIETATERAAEIADQLGADTVVEVPEDIVLSWVEGVKTAHSEQVREYYSRVMAAAYVSDENAVSGPSLLLLKQLDARLAAALEDFMRWRAVFGSYPWDGPIRPLVASAHTEMLIEIGFIHKVNLRHWSLRRIGLHVGGYHLRSSPHPSLALTERAKELAKSLFSGERIREIVRERPVTIVDYAANAFHIINEMSKFGAVILSYPAGEGSEQKRAILTVNPASPVPNMTTDVAQATSEINAIVDSETTIAPQEQELLGRLIERFPLSVRPAHF